MIMSILEKLSNCEMKKIAQVYARCLDDFGRVDLALITCRGVSAVTVDLSRCICCSLKINSYSLWLTS